jgi:hypothetical protein
VLPPLGASSLSQYRGRSTPFEWDLLTKCVVPAMAMTHAIERGVSTGCRRVAHSLMTQEGAPSRTRAPLDAEALHPLRNGEQPSGHRRAASRRDARSKGTAPEGATRRRTQRPAVRRCAQPRGRPRTRSAMMLR